MAGFAINDAWHDSVQETPFMLTYGQNPLKFLGLQTHSHVPAATDFTKQMREGSDHACECLKRA